jgi:hypothetical protein
MDGLEKSPRVGVEIVRALLNVVAIGEYHGGRCAQCKKITAMPPLADERRTVSTNYW